LKYLIIIAFSFGLSKPIASQNWEAISQRPNSYLNFLWKDTVENKLYISGQWLHNLGNDSFNLIAKYDGYNWSPLKTGLKDQNGKSVIGNVLSAIHYKNKILFGGYFFGGDTCKQKCLIYYDRQNFSKFSPEPFKLNQSGVSILNLRLIDDTLYICGFFDTIQGKPAKGFAKLVGNSWQPIDLGVTNQNYISDVIKYNNELYVIGSFENTTINDGHSGILKYNNGLWIPVGIGLQGGGATYITHTIVYKGGLYVGGRFAKASGNYGYNIQKWNSTTWSDVGNTADRNDGEIHGMKIFNNYLYILGSFQYAGDGSIPAKTGIARWDGTNWCSSLDSFYNAVSLAEYYNKHIVVAGGFQSVNTNTNIAYLAQLKCDDFCSDTCKYKLPEPGVPYANEFSVFPNPSSGMFSITTNGLISNSATIKVYDALGQVVISSSFKLAINLTDQASGLYYLQIVNNNKSYNYKLVINP
jgi:hypothetical protein